MSDDPLEYFLMQNAKQESRLSQVESLDSVPIVATAYRNAALSWSSGLFAVVNFDTTTYDTRSAVTTSPNWRFVAPIGGFYLISAHLSTTLSDTNWAIGEASYLYLYINGSWKHFLCGHANFSSGGAAYLHGTVTVYVAAGSYVELYYQQYSGAFQTITVGEKYTWISIIRIPGKTA